MKVTHVLRKSILFERIQEKKNDQRKSERDKMQISFEIM